MSFYYTVTDLRSLCEAPPKWAETSEALRTQGCAGAEPHCSLSNWKSAIARPIGSSANKTGASGVEVKEILVRSNRNTCLLLIYATHFPSAEKAGACADSANLISPVPSAYAR